MSDDIRIRLALDGAQEVQAGAQRAAEAVGRFGTAAQTAGQRTQLSGQQMAQVSAQLQDLFVQIQAGGSPITALIQQGSQLSSVFGGFGNALRGVASLVTPSVAVFGTLAASVAAGAAAYAQGSAEADAYRRAVVLTGNAAGVTVGQLQDMARAQADLAGTQGRAAQVLAQLAASGNVAAAQLGAAADAAIRLERAGGPAAEETAKKIAKLGEDPVKALIELNKAENFLTEGIYRQVKALQEQGRTAEAAALAQVSYAAAVGERAKTLESNLGSLERGWRSLGDQAKAAWDRMLGIGRQTTVENEVNKITEQIGRLRESLAGKGLAGPSATFEAFFGGRSLQQQIADLERLRARLQESIKLGADVANAERTRADAVKATIKAEQDAAAAHRSRQAAMQAGIAQAERDLALQERAIGLTGSYAKDLRELQAARARGVLTEQQYVDAVQKVIAAQPIVTDQLRAESAARQEAARLIEAQARSYEQQLQAARRSADTVAEQVQKLRDEEAAAGLAAAQNLTLAEAIQQVAIARLQERQARSQDLGEVDALQREIDARRELATLINSREARNAASRSAEDASRDWQRASQDIERSLTDALMRGFESGKGFAETLRDTVENLFRTMVLRPVISATLGLGGGTAAANPLSGGGGFGGSGLGGSLSSLQQLYSLLNGGVGTNIAFGTYDTLTNLGVSAGTADAAGLVAGTLGNAMLGYGLSKGLSGGYSAGSWVNTAAGIASAIPGIGPIAGVVGAAINRAFGRKAKETTASGLTGTIGGGDFAGQAYADWLQKGGWFRSDKRGTDFTAVDASLDTALDAGAKAILTNTQAWANALQLPAEQLASITTRFKVQLTGTAQENEQAIADLLGSYSAALTGGFATQLAPFQRQGETAAQTLERLAGSLTGVNNVLGVLGQSLLQVSAAGGDSASKLLEQLGGLGNFQALSSQYLQAYYSDAEKTALATQGLTQALGGVGLSLPASRDAYRQLIEQQDLNTDAGRKAYAVLLQLSGAFAELVPAVTEVGNASQEAARLAEEAAARQLEAGRRVLEDLTRQGGDLQVELLQAQGRVAEAAALQRQQTLAQLTAGLSSTDAAAVTTLLDLNTARRAEIDAIRATQSAAQQAADAAARQAQEAEQRALQQAQAVAAQRDGLVQRLLQIQGNTAELRARELAALDPTNRALQERINALQDQQTAEAEAARLAQQAAQQAQAIANERAGLEQRLLQLQGNTAELRARELAALDPTNRALQERINALQDQQTAEAEAARLAQQAAQQAQAIANERAGLEQRILQLQGNTAELRARELAALDPANRALQEQINALLDQQTAAEAAARASEQAAQALRAFEGVLGSLADQRTDLEAQLLTAQGKDVEAQALLRTRELARLTAGLTAEQAAQVVAAFDANEALRAQIQATTDAAAAAQALAAEQARAADQAQRAAEQFKSAWQSVTDTLFGEVQRIRGLISGGPGGLTLAQAQAQFAIATGQARAGDQEAARQLPGLSQALLELATANAGSLLELNRIRAAIAASLEQTGSGLAGRFGLVVPRLSTGTNLVPRDMLAMLHEGEAVVPKPFNPAAGSAAGSPEVVQQMRLLLDAIQAGDLATVRQLGELLRIVKTWDGNGLPEERVTT